ncbi:MAG: dTDP-4-dehydrorhamnose reductase [Pseudomonadota bacterium]|nr:dTDP-4-dehydrorhamnose reductase [Pseudomonadota bacterium]
MRVLVTGKQGQLAKQLQLDASASITLQALDREQCDIRDATNVLAAVTDFSPDVVINAAAYTAVDQAESDAGQAYAVNALGAENIARACLANDARLIHVSTDFVFNGQQSQPYQPSDAIDPLGVYGASKADGEQRVQALMPAAIILRTAWVYSCHGNNFMKTMLGLMAERDYLGVVADQIGTPTSTPTLAQAIFALIDNNQAQGIYHYTDAGQGSWYDFAVAIYQQAQALGLLPSNKSVTIRPIKTTEYPTPAPRPAYSVLDYSRLKADTGLLIRDWRVVLAEELDKILTERAQTLKDS